MEEISFVDIERLMLFPIEANEARTTELIARAKFKFRELDSSIEDRGRRMYRRSREPYGSRAPSMEVMGHDYTKKTLVGGYSCHPVSRRLRLIEDRPTVCRNCVTICNENFVKIGDTKDRRKDLEITKFKFKALSSCLKKGS